MTSKASNTNLIVEVLPMAALTPNPQNARLHPERHVRKLARSIEAFGYNCPLLVDTNNQIIAGHGRFLAVQHLGWTEVPVIRLEHLTPDQVRAFALADNVLTDASSWDDRLLAEQLKYLAEAELTFDLGAIGLELPEIDLRVQSLTTIDSDDDVLAPSDLSAGPLVSEIGDVWQLGSHRVACGSALEADTYERLLGGSKADLIISDLPFNLSIKRDISHNGRVKHEEFVQASGELSVAEFTTFLTQACAQMKHASRDGALLYLFMDFKHLNEILAAGASCALELKNLVVWAKNVGGMGSFYRSAHELIFVYKSGTAKHVNNIQLGVHGRNRTNVWNYAVVPNASAQGGEGDLRACHPTVKPVALIADAILDASERGDIVLDAFLGSGTAIIAAEKTGRIGYGIELDPKYVDTAVRRWQRLTGQQAIHAVTGQLFDVVAEEHACDPGLGSAAVSPRVSAEAGA